MNDLEREPSWLTAAADQRLAKMRSHGVQNDVKGMAKKPLISTPLTEPVAGATHEQYERWDRSCDNCGTFVPIGTNLYTGHVFRDLDGLQVVVTFGMCADCKKLP